MTIAKAINDIAAAQGGTPARPATIAGAIDALNDALAGSDQKAARTIEDAVMLLGEHIGGGGGGTEHVITCYQATEDGEGFEPINPIMHIGTPHSGSWIVEPGSEAVASAAGGKVLVSDDPAAIVAAIAVIGEDDHDLPFDDAKNIVVMPDYDLIIVIESGR